MNDLIREWLTMHNFPWYLLRIGREMGIKMFWLRWKHKNEQDDDWAGQNVAIDGDGVSHS